MTGYVVQGCPGGRSCRSRPNRTCTIHGQQCSGKGVDCDGAGYGELHSGGSNPSAGINVITSAGVAPQRRCQRR
jgi:hypothetical protein